VAQRTVNVAAAADAGALIAPTATHQEKDMPTRTDGEIQHDALDELKWDAAIDARNLGVSVTGGIVTITGQVSAYAEKREAERLAEMIPGVRDVVVDIEVVTVDGFSDTELGVAVNNALSWAAYLPVDAVSAQVKDGWVTLSGSVRWGFQRQNAEEAVRYMKGVRGLTNAIAIVNRGAAAGDIQANIEAALARRYDAQDQHILVGVNDRVVTLSGTVTNWWHRHLTRNSAWNAPGVEDVRDQMRIAD
jgi:osmotically-inducible protein OsmY